MASASLPAPAPSSAALLKAFDDTRTGVRVLVESGVSSVPELFRHPDPYASIPLAPPRASIPVVDLSLPFPVAAAAAASAARSWGFFQLVNHQHALPVPVPADDDGYLARALAAVRAFNELPAAERAPHYGRAVDGGVNYSSNVDLYSSPAASWRDTIQIMLAPTAGPTSRTGSRRPAATRCSSGRSAPPPWGARCWGSSPRGSASVPRRWRTRPAARGRSWRATTTRSVPSRSAPWASSRTRTPASSPCSRRTGSGACR
ncbi:hypothetical protein BS78_03G037300 [Paspalum vaginatum]|nr:hypothetical protein BS78_03G037300 [Paspalum vaginatum]